MYVAFHTGLKIKSFKQQVGAFIMSCCVYILSIIAYSLNKLHLEISNISDLLHPISYLVFFILTLLHFLVIYYLALYHSDNLFKQYCKIGL